MLNICTAHHLEAKPFINHYRLVECVSKNGQKYYTTENAQHAAVRLLVTGQGGQNCRLSLERFFAHAEVLSSDVWLNFGIAGSAEFPVGRIVLGEATLDLKEQVRHDLVLISHPTCLIEDRGVVVSTSATESKYQRPYIYDMEAATIAAEMKNRGMLDRLAVVKMISDGPNHPVDDRILEHVKRFIGEKLLLLTQFSDALIDLA